MTGTQHRYLVALVSAGDGASLADIAAALGVSRTAVQSSLQSLIPAGMVRQDEQGRYVPTDAGRSAAQAEGVCPCCGRALE